MQIAHRGQQPVIDPTAVVAPTAIISGDVQVGACTVVLAGAIITSQGAPVRIGQRCIIMEHAVIRGAGKHPCTLGDHVLVGPHAHITGATVHGRAFIATGASIFNGAVLEEGVVVAINAVVYHPEVRHVDLISVKRGRDHWFQRAKQVLSNVLLRQPRQRKSDAGAGDGHRRQGVMSALVAAALKAAKRANAPALEAYPVDSTRPDSTTTSSRVQCRRSSAPGSRPLRAVCRRDRSRAIT
jgi:carbonic anhydrase/acetyltransferase-like protein (isoleucine patch superfamily)